MDFSHDGRKPGGAMQPSTIEVEPKPQAGVGLDAPPATDRTRRRPERVLGLAVQKDGRLTQDTLALLHGCGLEFDSYRNRLFAPCRNFPLSILYGRDDDIPGYVASGTVDAGIVGRNLLIERGLTDRVQEMATLGFAPCRLVVAVPDDTPFKGPADLAGRRD